MYFCISIRLGQCILKSTNLFRLKLVNCFQYTMFKFRVVNQISLIEKVNKLKLFILFCNVSAAGFMSPMDFVEMEARQSYLTDIIQYIPKKIS